MRKGFRMIFSDFRWLLSFVMSLMLLGCTTPGTTELDADEWDIDTTQLGCTDTRKGKLRCETGQVVTNAGCGEEGYMRRCASCTPLAATTCAPNSAAIEVPECPDKEHGDCVPVEKRVRAKEQKEAE